MSNRKWEVSYYNDWNNPVILFQGSKQECEQWYEINIERCESCDAFIDQYSDSDYYEFYHSGAYYDAPMYYE